MQLQRENPRRRRDRPKSAKKKCPQINSRQVPLDAGTGDAEALPFGVSLRGAAGRRGDHHGDVATSLRGKSQSMLEQRPLGALAARFRDRAGAGGEQPAADSCDLASAARLAPFVDRSFGLCAFSGNGLELFAFQRERLAPMHSRGNYDESYRHALVLHPMSPRIEPMRPSSNTLSSFICFLGIVVAFFSSSASASTVRVDRSNGQVIWENTTSEPIFMLGYAALSSQSSSLNPWAWRSITESRTATGHPTAFGTWQRRYQQRKWVAETTPLSGFAVLPPRHAFNLGTGLWQGGAEDLEFRYFDLANLDPVSGGIRPTSAPVEYFGERGAGQIAFGGSPSLLSKDETICGLTVDLIHGGGSTDQTGLGQVLLNWGSNPYAGVAAISTPEPQSVVLGLLAATSAILLRVRSK
jgi:hypothetical protein